MLDPERMTLIQLFWLALAVLVALLFVCRWIDFNYQL
jgi:hypothetical protein